MDPDCHNFYHFDFLGEKNFAMTRGFDVVYRLCSLLIILYSLFTIHFSKRDHRLPEQCGAHVCGAGETLPVIVEDVVYIDSKEQFLVELRSVADARIDQIGSADGADIDRRIARIGILPSPRKSIAESVFA